MAKDNIKKKKVPNGVEEEKAPGIFQKIFYLVIIPILFIIGIFLGIASFTNFNVFEKAANLMNDSEEAAENVAQDHSKKVVELEAQVKEKEAEIDQLKSQLEAAKSESEKSQIEQERLQYEIDKLQNEQEEAKKEFKEILKSFEIMSAKSAAPILVEMEQDEALKILSNMKSDKLSEVLTKMTPEDAAVFTELLSK